MLQDRETKGLKEKCEKWVKRWRYNGANRRATGLLPEPTGENGHEMPIFQYANYKQLIAAIKANQETCCIKFSSEKQKSRGAILVFRGRVLGVLYGRKNLDGKLFQEEAYPYAIKDISDPETDVTAHVLSESLAVATASLFRGQFGIAGERAVGENAFSQYFDKLIESKMPGCILVHDSEDLAVLAAYIFGGKLVALYSGTEGWLPTTTEVALKKIAERGEVKVTSTLLEVKNIKEVTELTFKLTEVEDCQHQNRAGFGKQSEQASSIKKIRTEESTRRYPTMAGLVSKRGKGLCIEQELLARQRFAQLVLG
jgi:hypothetical protein